LAPSADGPDIAGFADAQERLRGHFGEVVVFLRPVEETWASGVEIDPETGNPYDPMAVPVASGRASAAVRADVAYKGRDEDIEWSALGFVEAEDVLLICSSGAASAASGAESALVRGEEYLVVAQRFDGIGAIQRFLSALRRSK
jgi:hypothetical protein